MSLANLKAEYFVGIVNMSDTSVQYVCTQRQTIPQSPLSMLLSINCYCL